MWAGLWPKLAAAALLLAVWQAVVWSGWKPDYVLPGPGPGFKRLAQDFANVNFDLGIVHYASDTPYTQARTLGARGLSYRGMDSTYASAIALARRILQREDALQS